MYTMLVAKRKIESFILSPFVYIGWLLGKLAPQEDFAIYFFFPFYHIGGAEKVHFLIAQAFTGKNCIIYFTRKSKGQSLKHEFAKAGFELRDISKFTDNKLLYPLNFIFRGIISCKINGQRNKPLVFNGQSNFGYKISPWISKSIPQVDLIHALNSFSKIRIPFLQFYKKSVTVSEEIIQKHRNLYEKHKVPNAILKNIIYINYGIELPVRKEKIFVPDRLKVLYVGRGSEEKRVHLIAQIAEEMHKIDRSVQFSFMGDVDKYIPNDLKEYCNQLGSMSDNDKIDAIYRNNDVLIVTSSTESGPLVAMEAMARGLSIVSTPVGIINEHIQNGRNGFVFSTVENESTIIKEGIDFLMKLKANIELRKIIAQLNMDYAYANFDIKNFQGNYRNLLKTLNPSL
jgi:L-malate glycosyltransferase